MRARSAVFIRFLTHFCRAPIFAWVYLMSISLFFLWAWDFKTARPSECHARPSPPLLTLAWNARRGVALRYLVGPDFQFSVSDVACHWTSFADDDLLLSVLWHHHGTEFRVVHSSTGPVVRQSVHLHISTPSASDLLHANIPMNKLRCRPTLISGKWVCCGEIRSSLSDQLVAQIVQLSVLTGLPCRQATSLVKTAFLSVMARKWFCNDFL